MSIPRRNSVTIITTTTSKSINPQYKVGEFPLAFVFSRREIRPIGSLLYSVHIVLLCYPTLQYPKPSFFFFFFFFFLTRSNILLLLRSSVSFKSRALFAKTDVHPRLVFFKCQCLKFGWKSHHKLDLFIFLIKARRLIIHYLFASSSTRCCSTCATGRSHAAWLA